MVNEYSNNMNNILILSISSTGNGGGDTHLNYLAIYWRKMGVNVNILTIKEFNKFNLFNNFKYSLMGIQEIMKLSNFKEEDILESDIILSASPYPADLFHSIRLGRKYNKKVMCYFHHIVPSLSYHPFRRGFFMTVLNTFYFKYALHLVKINNTAIFLDHPCTLKDTGIVVYEDLDAIEEEYKDYEGKIYDICYIGRVTKPKGIIDLIDVLRILYNENIKPSVAIVGAYDNKMKKKLDKLLHKFKLTDQVKFFGYVSNTKKIEILSSSKLYISLSYEEGWSISVMEAAFYGVPIIAYEIPAYSYLKGNYYHASISNLREISKLIKTLLGDITISNTYVKNAMLLVKEYNYNDIAKTQIKYMEDFKGRNT